MTALLFQGDPAHSAAVRHEVPLAMADPILVAVVDGRTVVVTHGLDAPGVREVAPHADLLLWEDLGFSDLLESGLSRHALEMEIQVRAVERLGVTRAVADPLFPLALADALRARRVRLEPDHALVAARRRVKTEAELAGIRRAQTAAEEGMRAAARALGGARVDGDRLRTADGGPLTAEAVRADLRAACAAAGAPVRDDVIVASVWQGSGHEPGSGPLPAGLPIQVDLWPPDEASGCFADMTRTFVVGDPPEEVRTQERLVREALEEVRRAVRPGVTGRELHALVCDRFERHGLPDPAHRARGLTRRRLPVLAGTRGGLELHEDPSLGQAGREPRGGRGACGGTGTVALRRGRGAVRGPRARHLRRVRDPHPLPVRPHALTVARLAGWSA